MRTITRLLTALLLLISMEGYGQVSVTATGGTTAGSYSTLNAAFAAINAGTHQGAINITITGNTTEPSPPTSLLGSGVGAASYTSVHISPSGGSWTVNSSAVPFAYRGIIELFGAQHVTIDGDPTGTGSRNLTFEVAQSSDLSTSAIRMGSIDNAPDTIGAAYDTIRNCNIIGGRDSINSTTNNYGIILSGNSISSVTTPVAYGCNYNTFINNTFSRCYYAIFLNGTNNNSGAGNINTLIRNNYFLGTTIDTSNNYCIYFNMFNTIGNSPLGIIDSNDFTATGNFLFYCITNYISSGRLTVSNNNIHDVNGPIVAGYDAPPASCYMPLNFYGNIWQNSTLSPARVPVNPSSYLITAGGLAASGKLDVYNNIVNNITSNNIYPFSLTGIILPWGPADSTFCHNNVITNISTAYGNVTGINASGEIYDNIISGISSTVSGNGNVYGLYLDNAVGSVYNNMICDITASVTQFNNGNNPAVVGMYAYTSSLKVYGNTIALNTSNQSGTIANAYSMALYCSGGNCKFQDNIIYNSQNSPNAFGSYFVTTNSLSSDTLDYNEYYVPYGNIGYTGATAETTLLDWQAATGVQDLHSLSGQVPFISTSNLHIDTTNAYANNVFRNGTYIPSVPVDIDGQTRNNPPCIGADEFEAVNALPDTVVWPGDADNNHVVNNSDLLPIGLGYDSTGPVRNVTGIVWQEDVAADWADFFTIYAPTVNYKYADCNGDGTINAADTTAIITNFSLTHAKSSNLPGPQRSGVPGFYLLFSEDTAANGDTLSTTISLGQSPAVVNNLYGLAFTFNYDPSVIDTNASTFTFLSSWLGSPANSIHISVNNTTAGTVQAAITGIDHTARSGSGAIATFRGAITTDNINGKDLSYYVNRNYISDITAIDQYGNPVALNAAIDSNYIAFTPNGIHDISQAAKINIYPNPANSLVRIISGTAMTEVTISDVLGNEVKTVSVNNKLNESIDISALEAGVYIIHVSTTSGTATAKLVVSR